MDSNQVENLISNVLKKGIKPHSLALRNLISEQKNNALKYHSEFNKEALDELVKYLKAIPEVVSIFDEKMMNVGNGATRVSIESLAKWLVVSSNEQDTKQAVSQLVNYLCLDKTPAIAILAISGIEVEDPIKISKNIKLVQFESLPGSTPKEVLYPPFLKIDFLLQQGFTPFHAEGGYRPPKAALVKNVYFSPKSYSDDEISMSPVDFTDLYDACEFLTLFSDSTPVPVGAWAELKNGVPCKELLGSGWCNPTPDVLSSKDVILSSSNWKDLESLYDSFSKMTQPNRDLLRIPIQRINQARRRKNNADRAIDQGVAFEALFLNDKSHKEQISFTFRLRASLLLGDTFERRQELVNFFSAFYSCRSQAAHTGKLDTKIKISYRGKVDTDELLKESDKLCISAIGKIIENGEFPDWNKLMLSVGTNAKD